jgi:hypothetical protein
LTRRAILPIGESLKRKIDVSEGDFSEKRSAGSNMIFGNRTNIVTFRRRVFPAREEQAHFTDNIPNTDELF